HCLVDAGLLGDRRNRHAVVAPLGEEGGAREDKGLARRGGVAAARGTPGRDGGGHAAISSRSKFQLNVWLIIQRAVNAVLRDFTPQRRSTGRSQNSRPSP